jgi:SAM-dependent methyltransferase
MTTPAIRYSPDLEPTIESKVRAMLIDYYRPTYKDRVESYVETTLATEPFADRFLYLKSVVGEDLFTQESSILISGFGMGSEMIMARQFGFGQVFGVEVEHILVEATKIRLSRYTDMYPEFYEGNSLPYEDGQFKVVVSGHVIEHTSDPKGYLQEAMRVLAPGGYLSLEFPHRYHPIELHTRLPSFEWLPRPLRNLAYRILSSKGSPLSEGAKLRYISIVTTHLQQISMGGIRRMLNDPGYPAAVIHSVHAAPGIIRCVIRRN